MRDTVESRQVGFAPRGNEFAHLGNCTTKVDRRQLSVRNNLATLCPDVANVGSRCCVDNAGDGIDARSERCRLTVEENEVCVLAWGNRTQGVGEAQRSGSVDRCHLKDLSGTERSGIPRCTAGDEGCETHGGVEVEIIT